jgi:hypothetical protein
MMYFNLVVVKHKIRFRVRACTNAEGKTTADNIRSINRQEAENGFHPGRHKGLASASAVVAG